ncbi:hypothetical protein AV530_005016 [Patagioenas fasciata monilis]|uniref:Uncharacterized protein n=1 Tax=Patagioenas fasciata monilis TaxID=372326 RepID=A0A1V4K5D9_PATFA|nr:hypothetical protein AV530_005016 [Patagioenas fasciata monilis]
MPDLSLGAACTQCQKRQEILDCGSQLLSYSLWLNMTFNMIQTTDMVRMLWAASEISTMHRRMFSVEAILE